LDEDDERGHVKYDICRYIYLTNSIPRTWKPREKVRTQTRLITKYPAPKAPKTLKERCSYEILIISIEKATMRRSQVRVDFVRPKSLPTLPTDMCSTATGYIVAAINLFDYTFAFGASFTMLIGPFIE